MKTDRLHRLQTWTIIVLIAYLLLALCAVFIFASPTSASQIWEGYSLRGEEIRGADSHQLQSYLHSAVVRLVAFRRDKYDLLLTIIVAAIGMVGFLGWSTFMIRRIKKEVDHAA